MENSEPAKDKLHEKIFTELTVRRSLYDKRQLQRDSSIQERRVRPKTRDYLSHSSSTWYPNSFLAPTLSSQPSSHSRLQTEAFYVLHPKGAESIISYPETIFDPHQAALNAGCSYFHFDQRFVKRNIFQDFFTPPFYFPLDVQEACSLKRDSLTVSEHWKKTYRTPLSLQSYSD